MEISASGDRITADLLVVGGGISGMTAAIEASEFGKDAVLIEKEPFLGGRVVRMNQYFPKMCPPVCGLEINLRRIRTNDRIKVLTLTEVTEVSGQKGDYEVTLTVSPRYINNNCTACEECEKVCEIEVDDEFNFGLNKRKAVYFRNMAYPSLYVADPDYVKDPKFKACVDACKYNAFDLDQQPQTVTVKCKGIVWATGWKPYDAAKLDNLGFGQYDNVITNVMLERYSAEEGPTSGKISRPSDGGEIKKIGFVQCAGSRDENHLPYCSGVCCSASLKQARYVRAQYPDAEIHIFYIDIRTPGRLEDFYQELQSDEKVFFHRGKGADIKETGNKNLLISAENTLTGELTEHEVELVVLATGMVPNAATDKLPADTPLDDWGFLLPDAPSGIIGAGVTNRPVEVAASVQDATGAVLKALTAERS
ncbi:CoB--CoM heterodisulfide reductase iron-sulfur subunit A family protein [bacterium]|nr:CoB--CoM heterodisulfide reductase iron-sulfur subunit A family protein [bacterium]MBU1882402.1 CoB--CoM heterodisulfide reductase iron-sulfur subunit A family protein [bacterium]